MSRYHNTLLILFSILSVPVHAIEPIQHDVEHYILLDQYADKWSAEDAAIDQVLAVHWRESC